MTPLAAPMELAGAYFNTARGDNSTNPNERPYRYLGRAVNIAGFALMVLAATYPYGMAVAAPLAILCGLGMWAGQAPGWGRYIGALAGTEKEELKEVPIIDAMIAPLHPDNVPHSRLGKTGQMMVWGLAGGTLRGAYWGVCLAVFPLLFWLLGFTPWLTHAASGAAWLVLTGATFGIVYGVVIHTYKRHPLAQSNPIGIGWQASEAYFGALLWGAFAVAFFT